MTREEFEQLVGEEFPNAIPERFRGSIKNVAFLVEDEPSAELREREGLSPRETLLGFYHGIPATARGDYYGVGATLPDTITLFQIPILDEAVALSRTDNSLLGISYARAVALRNAPQDNSFVQIVRKVIRETMWHEVAHHFGYDERQVRAKEAVRKSKK